MGSPSSRAHHSTFFLLPSSFWRLLSCDPICITSYRAEVLVVNAVRSGKRRKRKQPTSTSILVQADNFVNRFFGRKPSTLALLDGIRISTTVTHKIIEFEHRVVEIPFARNMEGLKVCFEKIPWGYVFVQQERQMTHQHHAVNFFFFFFLRRSYTSGSTRLLCFKTVVVKTEYFISNIHFSQSWR